MRKLYRGITTNTGAEIYGETLIFRNSYPVIVNKQEWFELRVLPETLEVVFIKEKGDDGID